MDCSYCLTLRLDCVQERLLRPDSAVRGRHVPKTNCFSSLLACAMLFAQAAVPVCSWQPRAARVIHLPGRMPVRASPKRTHGRCSPCVLIIPSMLLCSVCAVISAGTPVSRKELRLSLKRAVPTSSLNNARLGASNCCSPKTTCARNTDIHPNPKQSPHL